MKKMRRLIPAVAMLMVAAVMLSTASFAWFTMNEKVTATGMSVQAQASGSMIIDDAPLTALSKGISVDFANLGSKKLSPVTYDAGWKVPETPADVDYFTGGYNGKMVAADVGNYDSAAQFDGQYFVKRTVWVGLAGDSLTKNIQVDLACDINVEIANAYAIAFFVDNATAPALVLHVKDGKVQGKEADRLLFDAPVAIPSTVGVTATEENPGVGIKVTMYVFVDGSYKTGTQVQEDITTYRLATAATGYDPNVTYYVEQTEGSGVYVPAPQTNNDSLTAGGAIPEKWYIKTTTKGDAKDLYYVNNSYAPDAPSGLEVSFKLVDTSKTPAQGGEEAGE